MSELLDRLRAKGSISALDIHFARVVARLAADAREGTALAAAMLSRAVGAGHVCLDLPQLVARPLVSAEDGRPIEGFEWPDAERWIRAPHASDAVGAADAAGAADTDAAEPLVLEGQRLYMRRYFEHERRLALALADRADRVVVDVDGARLSAGLDRYFGAPSGARVARR